MRSLDVRSFNNWPITKLTKSMMTMVLNTNILPNNVVNTTVMTAVKPNDSIDLCHKIIPGIVAKILNTRPNGGNICKAKATTISVKILSTVTLGYIFENNFATPILFLTITIILTSLKLLYNYWQSKYRR